MTGNDETRIAQLEQRIEKLESLLKKEVARLDKYNKEAEKGFDHYVTLHRNEHHELANMIWPAFAKTHPGYVDDLLKFDEILGKPKDDGSDPQP
jgi:thymidylate synthase ThyX